MHYMHIHRLTYACRHVTICNAIKMDLCVQGDELQTVNVCIHIVHVCIFLVNVQFLSSKEAVCPQLLLQQCGQSNWKHEQHIYCITQMYNRHTHQWNACFKSSQIDKNAECTGEHHLLFSLSLYLSSSIEWPTRMGEWRIDLAAWASALPLTLALQWHETNSKNMNVVRK